MTYEENRRRMQGYKFCLDEIKFYGIEHCKHKFALRLMSTLYDQCFTVGYGEALVEERMREKAKEVEEVNTNQDDEDEEWNMKLGGNKVETGESPSTVGSLPGNDETGKKG